MKVIWLYWGYIGVILKHNEKMETTISYSLNWLKRLYIGDYILDYYSFRV